VPTDMAYKLVATS